jgi:DNA polymerase-1
VDAQQAMLPDFAALGVTNPASNPQLSQAFTDLGVRDPVLSDAGQVSTNKMEGLPRLLDPDQPEAVRRLAQLLVEYRDHDKLRTKTREISALVLAGDGHRVHPQLNALKARTGGMSIQRPALQNLPKNDQRIRAAFLAEDGHVLVGADSARSSFESLRRSPGIRP